jgi:glycerophosphoryl diester phosphodiesterase
VTEPRPIVIAHRGVPALLPEHTLEGYARAIAMGADYVEPDLVLTKDGALVARHENELSLTTDVARRFPELRTTKLIDGVQVHGWFTEDLTLSEVMELRARQPLPIRPKDHDDRFAIPTFDEILALVIAESNARGRRIGVYPETKHPSYFESIGLPHGPSVVRALAANGFAQRSDPVFVQSFERANLEVLRLQTDLRLVQLLDFAIGNPTPTGLRDIATYADAIGVEKRAASADDGSDTGLVGAAHDAGLLVHVYTFRDEPPFVARWAAGDPTVELARFYDLGVDGVFVDRAETALSARAAWNRRAP